MPRFINGDLFDHPTDVEQVAFIVTTNSVIRGDALVMGAGAARNMKDRYELAPWWAVEAIAQVLGIDSFEGHPLSKESIAKLRGCPIYGYLRIRTIGHDTHLGIFQTKREYAHKSHADLIIRSCDDLRKDAEAHPHIEFRVNFPGIGYGGLAREEVLPLLSVLPENVLVFEKDG
jgi:hypothetical protein